MRHRELHPVLVAIALALALSLVDDVVGLSEQTGWLVLGAIVAVFVPLAAAYAFARRGPARDVSAAPRRPRPSAP